VNIKDYIASGILESYIMGFVSAEEGREVERMAAQHPEVKAELQEIQLALESYAAANFKQPPAHLRSSVLAAVTSESEKKEAKVIDLHRTSSAPQPSHPSRVSLSIAIAAGFLLLISIAANYILSQKLKEERSNTAGMQAEMLKLSGQYAVLERQMNTMHDDMAVMKDPLNKMVRLKGMENSPASLATIYWNTGSKEVYLDVNSLPAPPQGMQYQLWAIVDGKPVDAGMIDMSSPGIHKMKRFESAQAFAVTLEKEGGSPAPNLSAMYVMGNV
jgi:anti-sigma-K factor RskA